MNACARNGDLAMPDYTVRELIAALSALPPDLPVYVDGYEGGIGPGKPPRVVRAHRDYHQGMDYYKPHAEPFYPDNVDPDDAERYPLHDAVLIER
jgi:hypothetical protein